MTDPLAANRLQALLVRSPVAAAFVSQGQFTVVSEPFNHMFGQGDDHDLGSQPIRAVFVSDASHAAVSERLAAAYQSGQPLNEEVEFVRRDGGRFWGKLSASPLDWDECQARQERGFVPRGSGLRHRAGYRP